MYYNNFADSRGDIVRTEDLRTNLEHRVTYDSTGRLISKDTLNLATADHTTDRWLRSMEYDYDLNNNLTRLAYADTNGSNVTTYTYGANNGNLMRLTYGNGNRVDYTYNRFGNYATVARFINGAYQLEKYDTFYDTF